MYTKIVCLAIVMCLISSISICAEQDAENDKGFSGNVNFIFGSKTMSNAWDESKTADAGIKLDFRHNSWPVYIACDLIGAGTLDETNAEWNIGARLYAKDRVGFNAFGGAGLTLIQASKGNLNFFGTSNSDDDKGTGYWVEFGFGYFGRKFNIGVDIVKSSANVNLQGKNMNAGGLHASILIGYRW